MTERLFLGIDTSNYTTSVALCGEDGEIRANIRIPLPVAQGERGLRQSDAVFAHIKNLPEAAARLREVAQDGTIAAVGCSLTPRDAEGSYMPCFLAGRSAAEMAAATLGVPLYGFSHQAGHVAAAVHSSGERSLFDRDFCAFHVSGGTTEVLRVHGGDKLTIETVGGTADLNAGQLVDRIGVRMGLGFPCGPAMERLAVDGEGAESWPVSVKGLSCNLSGGENKAAALYEKTNDAGLVSRSVFAFIGRVLRRLSDEARAQYGLPILYSGGVMSNAIIREMLADKDAFFAGAGFSADNAAGTAVLCRRAFFSEAK